MERIGIIGSAMVGQTLAAGFKGHGYDVRIASRTPEKLAEFSRTSGIGAGSFSDVAAWGEVLVLAVRGLGAVEALALAGHERLAGKIVIDVTNPDIDGPAVDGVIQFFTGANESLMERLQQACPGARFVKAWSYVGAARMVDPRFEDGRPTMFICGNDADAKQFVIGVLEQFGWDAVDMGTVVAARAIEPLAKLWCIPGFRQGSWTHAFKVLWK